MDFIERNVSFVKHKSSYSCESAIYFNLTTDMITNNCNFDFNCNKTDVTPPALDGGDEIVLANWPNDKHIICNVNNDIPIKIPSHPVCFRLTEVSCANCGIEADNHHLLESIATCDNKISNLGMYFSIDMAFTNYLNMLPNLTNSLPLIKDRTKYEQPLPLNLSIPDFDSSLKHAPTSLKNFIHVYANNKEIFDLKQRHVSTVESLNNSNKKFFSNNIVDIFMFTSLIISIISTTLVIYLFCKHKHIRTCVASLILHKIKEVEANSSSEGTNSECQTLAYIGIILTELTLKIVTFLHNRKSRLSKGYKFSNAVKIMLFISVLFMSKTMCQ